MTINHPIVATTGASLAVMGAVTSDQIMGAAGTVVAVLGALVSWFIYQRQRIADAENHRRAEQRDQARKQDLLDSEQRIKLQLMEHAASVAAATAAANAAAAAAVAAATTTKAT